jgi:predicted nuclease with TOPRIM domain
MKDEVIQALEGQVSCYRRLVKLAELQHGHVQQNQTEALLDVLRSRQSLLDEIMQHERVVGAVKRGWSEFVEGIESDERVRAESLLNETRSLLQQIVSADQNDAMVLQQRKLNLGRQINQASAAKQVNRNYAAAAYGNRSSRMDVQR